MTATEIQNEYAKRHAALCPLNKITTLKTTVRFIAYLEVIHCFSVLLLSLSCVPVRVLTDCSADEETQRIDLVFGRSRIHLRHSKPPFYIQYKIYYTWFLNASLLGTL